MKPEDQWNRIEKIRDWIEWGEDRVAALISRKAETASLSGFNDAPSDVPCSHPIAWQRERLCLLCDNTGWRPAQADEEGIDPYSLGVSQVKGGFTAKSAGDESLAQKRSARLRAIDAQLDRIQQDVDMREGRIGKLDAMMANVDKLSRPPHTFTKVAKALEMMRLRRPDLYRQLPADKSILWLSQRIPGRINHAP